MEEGVSGSDLSRLEQILQANPAGLKEYDLLKLLYEPLPAQQRPNLANTLVLFQQHFLLFHSLYRLRDQLHGQQRGHLLIDVLNIQWLPYSQPGTSLPTPDDPLRHYYLELSNLHETDQQDVDALIGSFWKAVARLPDDDRACSEALTLMGLENPVSWSDIKRRYRALITEHHPDRGGNHDTMARLNNAYDVLKVAYGA